MYVPERQQEVVSEASPGPSQYVWAGSLFPIGVTHLFPIWPDLLGTVHREVPVSMTALNFLLYVFISPNLFVTEGIFTKGL